MATGDENTRVLVVWHSRTGASRRMALEAAEAAAKESAVDCLKPDAVTPEIVLPASAYLFVCPENLGSMSGAMKEFFDRHYYPVLGRIEGRPYASIIAAGSDGSGAQAQLDKIVTGWRLKRVMEPMIINFDAQTPEAILAEKKVSAALVQQCRELGAALGAGAAMGVF